MKIRLSPESPRTLTPIKVDLEGTSGLPEVVVSSGGRGLFAVEMKATADGPSGVFWVAQPGDYEVRAAGAGLAMSRAFHVNEQAFLPFPVEFGVFSLALFLAGGGLFLWFRSRRKAGSTSVSSPS